MPFLFLFPDSVRCSFRSPQDLTIEGFHNSSPVSQMTYQTIQNTDPPPAQSPSSAIWTGSVGLLFALFFPLNFSEANFLSRLSSYALLTSPAPPRPSRLQPPRLSSSSPPSRFTVPSSTPRNTTHPLRSHRVQGNARSLDADGSSQTISPLAEKSRRRVRVRR